MYLLILKKDKTLMKNSAIILSVILVILLSSGCKRFLVAVTGQDVEEVYATLDTPEPGTKIDPVANVISLEITKYMENPDSALDKYDFVFDLIPTFNNSYDTIISNEDLNVPLRIYKKWNKRKEKDLPVIVFYHGGGFIFGDLEIYDFLCRTLANRSEYIIVSVDYRLAPKFKFPAAINDCYFALEWVNKNIEQFGGSSDKIYVMGDSAGGNIATVMTLKSQKNNGPKIKGQVLFYPATTFDETLTPSKLYFSGREGPFYILSEDFMRQIRADYMPDSVDVRNPYLSPLLADLNKDLPPALIITAQIDPLRDEGKLYADSLKSAGVYVEYKEYAHMMHAFVSFSMLLKEGDDAINQSIDFLKRINDGGWRIVEDDR